jgi:hypothetical protein
MCELASVDTELDIAVRIGYIENALKSAKDAYGAFQSSSFADNIQQLYDMLEAASKSDNFALLIYPG